MISLKSREQLELSFYPLICWRKLSRDRQHEILEQLSLLLLSNLGGGIKQHHHFNFTTINKKESDKI